MEHSESYNSFIKYLNATGLERTYGALNDELLEEIFDWERDEVEDLIWEGFKEDKFLVIFLPKLNKYDGLQVVKDTIKQLEVPSYESVEFAVVLYENTKDEKYIDLIAENIHRDPKEMSYVVKLSECTPCSSTYNYLTEIYVNNDNSVIRSTAAKGILYNKGLIDPFNLDDTKKNSKMRAKFKSDDKLERIKLLRMFEQGELFQE